MREKMTLVTKDKEDKEIVEDISWYVSGVKEVIERAPYLLSPQKSKLLKELSSIRAIEFLDPFERSEENALMVIKEVFYRFLGISWEDLNPIEETEIKQLVKEILK